MKSESSQGMPVAFDKQELEQYRQFMEASWEVLEKTVFVRGHVFAEDGMFPNTIKRAFDLMTRIHSRDDWDPGASKKVEPTDENIKVICKEKEEAEEQTAS